MPLKEEIEFTKKEIKRLQEELKLLLECEKEETKCELCSTSERTYGKPQTVVIKPQTHADTIRGMTDEELADAFMAAEKYGRIHNGQRTKEWWLDWLRQEATE